MNTFHAHGLVSAVVLGGAGHVGLPLSLVLASSGVETTIYDISEHAVSSINRGEMPFWEPGAESLLRKSLDAGLLKATTDPSSIQGAEILIVIIGTPVDEHSNPDPESIIQALSNCRQYLHSGQLVVLRSTIYPGVTRQIEVLFQSWGLQIDVAFAPERIAEHNAIEELSALPQIVSSRSESGFERAAKLFMRFAPEIVRLTPEEAELAKLFTNSWRYVKFAMANQFFMMAESQNLNYAKIREGLTYNYPRASDLPGAGFAAGPCLLKDTMQLAAFSNNQFQLGHSAMLVNEGLPLFLVSRLERDYDLPSLTIGILGMAFKGGSDDIRSSLAYKLKRVLRFKAGAVLTTDPKISEEVDRNLLPLEVVIEKSDLLILGAPHSEYKNLTVRKPIVDIWNFMAVAD